MLAEQESAPRDEEPPLASGVRGRSRRWRTWAAPEEREKLGEFYTFRPMESISARRFSQRRFCPIGDNHRTPAPAAGRGLVVRRRGGERDCRPSTRTTSG